MFLKVFPHPPNILTTSLLWSPHPVIHLPHFVSLICWAPNSDHDAFLPECLHALDDCLKGLNPTWFQPVFPASFSRRLFPLCTLQPLRVLGISHGCHAFLCHQLLFLFSPTCLSWPTRAFLHLLPSPESIDSQSLPLLCFHSTSWICEFVFIFPVWNLLHFWTWIVR